MIRPVSTTATLATTASTLLLLLLVCPPPYHPTNVHGFEVSTAESPEFLGTTMLRDLKWEWNSVHSQESTVDVLPYIAKKIQPATGSDVPVLHNDYLVHLPAALLCAVFSSARV